METSCDDFRGYEEIFPVKEDDDLNKLKIKNIKFACHNPKCNATFNSERQRDKHSVDCWENNLQSEEITFKKSAKFRDEFKENKKKISSKNPVKPVKQKKISKKAVNVSNPVKGRFFSCTTCLRSYKYKSSLSLHKKTECGKEKKFICPVCENWRTYHLHNLKKHLNGVHGKEL